jgi:hypothetical protein
LLAGASLAALVLAGLAVAAYSPRLLVAQETYRQTQTPAVAIVLAQPSSHDPTAKITIYAPLGYRVNLGQAPGTRIGSVLATVIATDLTGSGGRPVPLAGSVTTDAPSKYVSNPCAPGLHAAVWILNAALPGGPQIQIPVYVDPSSGAAAAFSSATLQVCFGAPDVPAGTPGRAQYGAKFVSAIFTAAGVFTNPGVRGLYAWRAAFTPYTPGTGRPNVPGTVEEQGIVPIPYQLTLGRLRATRRASVRLSGTLFKSGRPVVGARLPVYAVGKTSDKRVGFTTKTNKRGHFAFTRRSNRKTTKYYVEYAGGSAACVAPTVAPAGCQQALVTPIDSRDVSVPGRRRP